jgi:hypothetical protein
LAFSTSSSSRAGEPFLSIKGGGRADEFKDEWTQMAITNLKAAVTAVWPDA